MSVGNDLKLHMCLQNFDQVPDKWKLYPYISYLRTKIEMDRLSKICSFKMHLFSTFLGWGMSETSPLGLLSSLRYHPYILRQQMDGVVGWSRKVSFADVQYCIYTDEVGGWVKKSSKPC